jgi:hypothetical protein
LNADGSVATRNGTWTQVPRSSLGNATFTIGASPTTTTFNDYGFSGWDLQGIAATNTATFFAIVVGAASLTAAETVNFDSISLVPGDIPTRPAPLTGGLAEAQCQRYYETSFDPGTIPAPGLGLTFGIDGYPLAAASGIQQIGPSVNFKVSKVSTPVMVLYNPINLNNQIYNTSNPGDCTGSAATTIGENGFIPQCINNGGSASGNALAYSWTADARLGV